MRLSFRPNRTALLCTVTSLVLALAASLAAAQELTDVPTADLAIPPELVRVESGTIRFLTPSGPVDYLGGLGWSDAVDRPVPRYDREGRLVLPAAAAADIGLPRISAIRSGIDGSVARLVLDFADVDSSALEPLRSEASVTPGRPLRLPLPAVALPVGTLAAQGELALHAEAASGSVPPSLLLEAPPAEVRVFPLAGPTRLVLDLAPEGAGAFDPPATAAPPADGPPADGPPAAAPEDRSEELAPGVRYLRTQAPGASGPSTVHVLEVDPNMHEFRVVGAAGEGRPVTAWAQGAVAAINAGYFRTSDHAAIGLRRIDGTLLTWPSRNRAAIGFGPGGTVVARASARVQVRLDGLLAVDVQLSADGPLEYDDARGARVGSARTGVLVLDEDGVVTANRVGPAFVPQGGAVLAYDASFRPLALAEPGTRVSLHATLTPPALEGTRWAVEAGPLLLQDGAPAFDPELERFQRGVRILDEVTQQAAVGVRPDGTVLFVVAERMVAEDLIPLFLRLGASDALRMDSGGSSTLVADGRPLNRILLRPVESAIVAVPSGVGARAR